MNERVSKRELTYIYICECWINERTNATKESFWALNNAFVVVVVVTFLMRRCKSCITKLKQITNSPLIIRARARHERRSRPLRMFGFHNLNYEDDNHLDNDKKINNLFSNISLCQSNHRYKQSNARDFIKTIFIYFRQWVERRIENTGKHMNCRGLERS